MPRWGTVGRGGSGRVPVLVAVTGTALALTLAGCSTSGTVGATGKPSPTPFFSSKPLPTNQSLASGSPSSPSTPGSPTTSAARDATVSQAEAAAALKAYETQNNNANGALDTAQIAKAESGSLLAVDQAGLLYAQGIGGDRAKQDKAPMALNNPVFYIPRSLGYPRAFFVTTTAVQPGAPSNSFLMHFSQDRAGAPWLADSVVVLLAGQQWPAFAVGSDGLLDYGATQQDELPLDTVGVAAADRGTLTDNDAGQPDSAFLNDDVTLAELKWIQNENDEVSPADVAMTISTELNPAPTYLPLKNGGELTLYGTRFSLRVSQSGRTFSVDDQGWAKIAGATSFQGGFTIESVWMVAAIDPPDKTGKIEKIEKIASNGGPVSMR